MLYKAKQPFDRLDGVWSIKELETRVEGLSVKADPNFKHWLMALKPFERRYVLGYILERFTGLALREQDTRP